MEINVFCRENVHFSRNISNVPPSPSYHADCKFTKWGQTWARFHNPQRHFASAHIKSITQKKYNLIPNFLFLFGVSSIATLIYSKTNVIARVRAIWKRKNWTLRYIMYKHEKQRQHQQTIHKWLSVGGERNSIIINIFVAHQMPFFNLSRCVLCGLRFISVNWVIVQRECRLTVFYSCKKKTECTYFCIAGSFSSVEFWCTVVVHRSNPHRHRSCPFAPFRPKNLCN